MRPAWISRPSSLQYLLLLLISPSAQQVVSSLPVRVAFLHLALRYTAPQPLLLLMIWQCVLFFSAAKSCLALCGPMDCITQSFPSPVLYCLSRSLIIFFSIESVMHPTDSFSAALFSSCLQSFPASGSFPMGRLFASGHQGFGASASTAFLPMRLISFRTDWFDLFVVQGTVKSKPFSFVYLFTLWLPHWMNFHGAGTWLPCLEECLSHGQWSLAICWVCEWC